MAGTDRLLLALAGLAGGLGVAASAAAAHGGGSDGLRTAAQFLLFHAPAVMALVALAAARLAHGGVARLAAGALVLGLALFSGDLAMRALAGHALFPMAAPTGGVVLMLGWLAAAAAGLIGPRGRAADGS